MSFDVVIWGELTLDAKAKRALGKCVVDGRAYDDYELWFTQAKTKPTTTSILLERWKKLSARKNNDEFVSVEIVASKIEIRGMLNEAGFTRSLTPHEIASL